MNASETYVRWQPVAGLPEEHLGAVELTFAGEELVATALYAADDLSLRIEFGRVEAFKVYEEFSDPWMDERPSTPHIRDAAGRQWTCPFQEVLNSRWVARVLARNHGLQGRRWRHFIIVTTAYQLHVLTDGDPDLVNLLRPE